MEIPRLTSHRSFTVRGPQIAHERVIDAICRGGCYQGRFLALGQFGNDPNCLVIEFAASCGREEQENIVYYVMEVYRGLVAAGAILCDMVA